MSFKSDPIGLAEFSRALADSPQIEEARIIEGEGTAGGGSAGGGNRPRRIEIVLAEAAVEGQSPKPPR